MIGSGCTGAVGFHFLLHWVCTISGFFPSQQSKILIITNYTALTFLILKGTGLVPQVSSFSRNFPVPLSTSALSATIYFRPRLLITEALHSDHTSAMGGFCSVLSPTISVENNACNSISLQFPSFKLGWACLEIHGELSVGSIPTRMALKCLIN